MSSPNVLPEGEWLCNYQIVWKKSPRPSVETIQHCLEGHLEGIGVVEWRDPFFHIKLPGTPKILHRDTCTFEMNPDGHVTREIYVLLEEKRILVKCATEDYMTQRIAEALCGTLYGIQGYQDEQKSK